MQKLKKLAGVVATLVVGLSLSSFTFAHDDPALIYGENIFPNGDFSLSAGEYVFPSVAPSEGVVAGFGVIGADIPPVAFNDNGNTIVRASGAGFSSFFKLLTIESGATYTFSFDYKVEGTTDNIGFAFWCPSLGNRLPETNIMDPNQNQNVTFTDLEDGWKKATTVRTFDAGQTYDSLQVWMNVSNATIYLDNLSLVKEGTTENIITGGDFEGFLEYASDSQLTMTPNDNGIYGQNAALGINKVTINNDGIYGAVIDGLDEDKYQIDIGFLSEIVSGAKLTLNVLDSEGTSLDTISILGDASTIKDNLFTAEYTPASGVYGKAEKVQLEYEGTAPLELNMIGIRPTYVSVFDPDKTYYEGENQVVNGDFEAFDAGTVMSETQLEGAWGSVALDTPGQIVDDNGNKVARIGRSDASDTHAYSSMFLMTPDTIAVGDLIRLRYDYKLEISQDPEDYMEIYQCFVGGANTPYYSVDFKRLGFDDTYKNTSGHETIPYPIKTEALANGYTRVTVDFQVTMDKVQWNSVRWLITPLAEGDYFYLDNVEMRYLSDEAPTVSVTSVTINEGDQELKVGEKVQLTATIAPTDAEDKTLTWESSDPTVASVSATGEVTALKEGSTRITVTSSNGKTDDIIVTVLADGTTPVEPSDGGNNNLGLIIGLTVGGVAIVIIALVLIYIFFIRNKGKKVSK